MGNEQFAQAGAQAAELLYTFRKAFMQKETELNPVPLAKWPTEYINEVQHAAHKAFCVFYQAYMDGLVDEYGVPREFGAGLVTDEGEEAEEGQTCIHCWCNTCGVRDNCKQHPETDGVWPPPCEVCAGSKEAHEPFIPRTEGAPPCYIEGDE